MVATNGNPLGQGKAPAIRRKRFKPLPKFNGCGSRASYRYVESQAVLSQTLTLLSSRNYAKYQMDAGWGQY